jgi:hypothetical protein
MFDPDANVTRINREMAYLTSGIGGRSKNSRRLMRINIFPTEAFVFPWSEKRDKEPPQCHPLICIFPFHGILENME